MSFNPPQVSSKPTISAQIANLTRMGSRYDPVPPYEMEDVESTAPPLSNDQISMDTITQQDDQTEQQHIEDQEEQHSYDYDVEQKRRIGRCSNCHRRHGSLTQRESCRYAIVFLVLILTALCVMTYIVASAAARK